MKIERNFTGTVTIEQLLLSVIENEIEKLILEAEILEYDKETTIASHD